MMSATETALGRDGGVTSQRNRWALGLLLTGLWIWACVGCSDEWTNDPMYSYGWFVPPLMMFFAWRRLDEPFEGREPFAASAYPARPGLIKAGVLGLALLAGPVELLRNEMYDDRLNNWGLAICSVFATLSLLKWAGGWRMVATMAFPVAFFLTAVAWPRRYETPVTVGLQKFVTAVIVEVLHVSGIHADPRGTTIYLDSGPVGIAEACSGVRSLQASLMISLAIGELFFLRWSRRLALVAICAVIATVLNLIRTLALCLITHYSGAHAMEKAHDWIGNAILLILPLMAWVAGRGLTWGDGFFPTRPLPRKAGSDGTPPPTPYLDRFRARLDQLDWGRMPRLASALVLALCGIGLYHGRIAYLSRVDPPQLDQAFQPRLDRPKIVTEQPVRKDVWEALSPTKGGNYAFSNFRAPVVSAQLFHFFWKPAAANRWATSHRPDICMPAGGWEPDGPVEPVDVSFQGRIVKMNAFRFKGRGLRALQIWGIWRNGEPLALDFFNKQDKRDGIEWSMWSGKSHSAIEVLSCVLTYEGETLPVSEIVKIPEEVFRFQPFQSRRVPVVSSPQPSDGTNAARGGP